MPAPESLVQSVLRACSLGAMLLGMSASGYAGSINYVGTDLDLGGGWRTSPVPKNDIDNNNVLGSDGWYVAGAAGSIQLPVYLTLFSDLGNSVYPGNSGYASIDDPNTTPGASPTMLQSGTLNPFPSGPSVDLVFTFGGSVPNVVRLGLMIDNLDIIGFNPSGLQVVQVGGSGSAVVSTTSGAYNDQIPDWVYFDLQAQPGETYSVIVSPGDFGCACLGATAFDSVSAPEPSTFGLAGLGAVWLSAAALGRRCRFRATRHGKLH